ncbi:MAG: hypothetical protein JW944_01215 [Deltaproteobacteria bacterium]|nr:hypothetical protein [Deltaproteobacteria bacterium]
MVDGGHGNTESVLYCFPVSALFNEIVVQTSAKHILDEFNVRCRKYQENYYTSDSVETVACLIAKAVQAGLTIFNCVSAEDVVMRTDRVIGLVLNGSPVEMAGLHIDPLTVPLTVRSKFIIDATGHATEEMSQSQSLN